MTKSITNIRDIHPYQIVIIAGEGKTPPKCGNNPPAPIYYFSPAETSNLATPRNHNGSLEDY